MRDAKSVAIVVLTSTRKKKMVIRKSLGIEMRQQNQHLGNLLTAAIVTTMRESLLHQATVIIVIAAVSVIATKIVGTERGVPDPLPR